DLDVILLKALRKEPARRYTSVEQFSEDIGRYLAGQPVIARKDTFGYRAAKFLARHAAAAVAGTIAVLALLAASIASFYSVRAVRQERERAERQLIDADLRMGDLERGLGQMDDAKKSYERALATAQPRWSAAPGSRALASAVARAGLGLGDLLERQGNRFGALDHYREAVKTAEAAGGSVLLAALERTGRVEADLGNIPAALETARRYLETAEKTPHGQPAVAMGHEWIGRLMGNGNGIPDLTRAVGLYRQLPAERAGLARSLSGLGDALSLSGRRADAIPHYRQSIALADSPAAEVGLATALLGSGETAEARVAAVKAVEQAKVLGERVTAKEGDLRSAAEVLLAVPLPELRDPALAQRFALQAVAMTKDNDPLTLDVLARAYG
ncbi:MAG: hypothetical protein ACRD9L_00070, partial [Bryobacteraceae bacterium]